MKRKRVNIKKTLQDWEPTLKMEMMRGNDDAQVILDWMKQRRWLKSQQRGLVRRHHSKPRPKLDLRTVKPRELNEV